VLVELVVENYAVIEKVRVRFHPGLNLLTGETGSGKSIVVDALGLLLGGRASSEMVRTGAQRARIAGIFEVASPALARLLESAGLETEDGELYLVMEYLVGTALATELSRGPMTLARGVDILEQMCAALARAHDLGVVHRDLKSDNILLTVRGGRKDFVKILDFGLAGLARDPRLAPKGAVFGTPEYMSPEQARGEDAGPQSDLYAIGVLFFEMLALEHPLQGVKTVQDVLDHIDGDEASRMTRGAGGTQGGVGMFLAGAAMVVAGGYLLLTRVSVFSGGITAYVGAACAASDGGAPIGAGDFVLIDLWAKEPAGVYADITWTGYAGAAVPARYTRVFDIVRRARDAGVDAARRAVGCGAPLRGCEVDAAVRDVIAAAGFADRFVHRTGHSIGTEVHGNGANIDGFETPDTRRVLSRTCFSIEPGIYLPGEFGVRSELNVYVDGSDIVVTGQPVQAAVVAILGDAPGMES
jgi:energy-coupling factor transporter ATP-binding protein EcfA2